MSLTYGTGATIGLAFTAISAAMTGLAASSRIEIAPNVFTIFPF
jgi:hypothetical protein